MNTLKRVGMLMVAGLIPAVTFASEGTATGGTSSGSMIALATALCMALAAVAGATAQGRAVSSALEGIARNPQAQKQIFTPMIIGLALIESLVIYALVISFMLLGKI